MQLPLTEDGVREFVFSLSDVMSIFRNVKNANELRVREIGDGNINFVFLVEGPLNNGVIIKQGLPYIRIIGESWKLTQDRVKIEASWLHDQRKISPNHVPQLYHFDPNQSLIVMEYLPPPYMNLRAAILQGEIYPKMARHVVEFLTSTLFHGSRLALRDSTHHELMQSFHNPELVATTAKVIFVDPYHDEPLNQYLKPELNEIVNELWSDVSAKIASARLRDLFLTKRQSVIHGDFHTGSVMACANGLYAIDAEFAFAGPMGFDIGKFIGNLLLAYFALDGHSTKAQPRIQQQEWLLSSIIQIWNEFKEEFLKLWNENKSKGELLPTQFVEDVSSNFLVEFQKDFFRSLMREVFGFAGACMIRRIVSVAQIQDFTTIPNRKLRAICSKRALKLAKILLSQILLEDSSLDVEMIITLAKKVRNDEA
eukprot:g6653.t1